VWRRSRGREILSVLLSPERGTETKRGGEQEMREFVALGMTAPLPLSPPLSLLFPAQALPKGVVPRERASIETRARTKTKAEQQEGGWEWICCVQRAAREDRGEAGGNLLLILSILPLHLLPNEQRTMRRTKTLRPPLLLPPLPLLSEMRRRGKVRWTLAFSEMSTEVSESLSGLCGLLTLSHTPLSLSLTMTGCVETFARELKEDEETVLKVLEACHGREEMARINAREVTLISLSLPSLSLTLLICGYGANRSSVC
jgi:hypothetical protein